MASSRSHFTDRQHPLVNTPSYGHEGAYRCNICLFKLAGFGSHHCNTCHIHIHDACADDFRETIDFFAHPWHPLTLRRIPSERFCDLCKGHCSTGSFVYSCVKCSFDVHPLCSKLQRKIRSRLHPGHDLRLLPSTGDHCACAASCGQRLPVWHYRCSCSFRLHITCASSSAERPTAAGNHGSYYSHGSYGNHGGSSYGNHGGSYGNHGSYGDGYSAAASGGGQTDIVITPNPLMNAIAKFLLKTSFDVAISAVTGGLPLSPLVEILSAALLDN